MEEVAPSLTSGLHRRSSGVLVPAAVIPLMVTIWPGDPDKLGHGVGHLPEFVLGAFPGGDVLSNASNPVDIAGGISNGKSSVRNPVLFPIQQEKAVFNAEFPVRHISLKRFTYTIQSRLDGLTGSKHGGRL